MQFLADENIEYPVIRILRNYTIELGRVPVDFRQPVLRGWH